MPATRRSSRIRAGSATPRKSAAFTHNRLASLAEDEASSPPTTANNAFPPTPLPRTPTTGSIKPSREDMHPSKAQQSTAKQPDSGLRFGFTDVGAPNNQQTPSKAAAESSFEFRFARPGPELSADAQKLMDDLRGEALRVKALLVAERDEAAQNAKAEAAVAGRKIAQARGKVGRFSDVHMAEFRKMDSIADHASSFRAQPTNATPLKPALKRSQSQAKLAEREDINKAQHNVKVSIPAEQPEADAQAQRFKRIRQRVTDDTSSARPVSRDGRPSTPQKQVTTLSAIATPTQSSLARAVTTRKSASQIPSLSRYPSKSNLTAVPPTQVPTLARSSSKSNLKSAQSTQIPTLSRSPSKQNLIATPQKPTQSSMVSFAGVPRSEPKPLIHSPGKVDRLKSMLRYPSLSARKPSAARGATSFSHTSSPKPDLNKHLPNVPSTPEGSERSKVIKHVTFTPETVGRKVVITQHSPSPVKSGIPRSTSKPGFFTKPTTPVRHAVQAFKSGEVNYPSLAGHPSLQEDAKTPEFRSTAGVRPLPIPPRSTSKQAQPPPSVPGTFTFRSDHTIDFGNSPGGFGASPGQASVRQVRSSIFPNMPGSFPTSNKENKAPTVGIAHGLQNKKRHRASSDHDGREEEHGRSTKKVKTDFTYGANMKVQSMDAPKTTLAVGTPSPAKKKGLSLSRLNMLAKPKARR